MGSRVGMVKVTPGILLKPQQHIDLVADRLQELITESEMTSSEFCRIVYDAMDPEGITVWLDDVDSAGITILAGISSKLQWAGSIIYEPTVMNLEEAEGLKESFEEMTASEWLNLASMPLL
jgi:hypothetical protein